MSCEATVRQHPSHFIGNSVNAMFRSNKQTRRRILRGRKVLGIEQIEAEIGVSSESSSMSELNSESSRCKVDDRRQMMHELAVIRERQRLVSVHANFMFIR
ncbi:unnamed protein product [Anisakis simplex]|uniref:Uncharacterized protein n=1 Tax=Anisakis simplex TaxID=6269 RepID=A0A0M3JHF1_ANISI|nr:unnamed protein product [Anisakis simplex]